MSELTVPVSSQDHKQGSDDAPVVLVEYGDYECPFCGAAHVILKKLQKDLGKDKFQMVFRNFPLSQIHPHALEAAFAAEAAGKQGKFWAMHDMLFEHQDSLEEHDLVSYAYALKLDVERFIDDMESEAVAQKVHEDFWSGVRSGVNGTPTFFINGERHDGSYSYGELRHAIELAAVEGIGI
jgi:protein-disulfide isomerase